MEDYGSAFQDVFFLKCHKAIFSWGSHYLISVLYCFQVIFFCASFLLKFDLMTLNSKLCHIQYFCFNQNQLKSVPDDYYVRVMGIVTIFSL